VVINLSYSYSIHCCQFNSPLYSGSFWCDISSYSYTLTDSFTSSSPSCN